MGREHLKLIEQSVTVPWTTTRAIGETCRKVGMVFSIGVNERDGGTLYNTQLLFDADGTLIQMRRKISPTQVAKCTPWRLSSMIFRTTSSQCLPGCGARG